MKLISSSMQNPYKIDNNYILVIKDIHTDEYICYVYDDEKEDTVRSNRRKYIGGSDIPSLFEISKFKTYKELLKFYTTNEELPQGNIYTNYGTFMEEKIRDYANKKLNLNAIPESKIFENEKIRCNTDGYDKDKKVILEIKTNNGKHNDKLDYEVQLQLYLWAFNCEKGYLIEYERPKDFYSGLLEENISDKNYYDLSFDETKVKIKEYIKNDDIITAILNKIETFWKDVEKEKQ